MVVVRFAYIFRGITPPTFQPEVSDSIRVLGNDFYLIEFELDGSLAAKHGNDHADRIFVDLNAVHTTSEAAQRTIEDADSIANSVVDNDLLLLDTHCVNFFFGQGSGIVAGSAHETSNAADIPDDMPSVIAVDHLDQHIAGVDLTVVSLAHAGFGDLGDGLQGNGDSQDLILQLTRLNGLLDGGLYGVFITGIGMDDIPFCSLCHNLLP